MKNLGFKLQVVSIIILLTFSLNSCEKNEEVLTNPIIGKWENFEIGSDYSYLHQFTFNDNNEGQLYFLEKSLVSHHKFESTDSLEWSTSNNELEVKYINRSPIYSFKANYEIKMDTLILTMINEDTSIDKTKFIKN